MHEKNKWTDRTWLISWQVDSSIFTGIGLVLDKHKIFVTTVFIFKAKHCHSLPNNLLTWEREVNILFFSNFDDLLKPQNFLSS